MPPRSPRKLPSKWKSSWSGEHSSPSSSLSSAGSPSRLGEKIEANGKEFGLSDARHEAMNYVMNDMSAQSESLDSSKCPDGNENPRMLSSDDRRISSLTCPFVSVRAPRAPGEHLQPAMYGKQTERTSRRVAFVESDIEVPSSQKKPNKRTKGSDLKSKENGEMMRGCGSRVPQFIEKQRVLQNISAADAAILRARMSSTASDSTSLSEGVHVVSSPSMVTIPELEVSSVPAPLPNLQRQRDLAVPGAWSIPRVLRSFVSANRQRDNSEENADNTSQTSHNTVRSLLSAAWSLILPTRRLESVLPIAVKPANNEPAIRWRHIFCGLGFFVFALLTVISVFVVMNNLEETQTGEIISGPTAYPTSSLVDFTLKPLPDKPDPEIGIGKPRWINNSASDSGNGTRRRQENTLLLHRPS
jgi:hypothetical protein